jgi:primosomal protein N' (replication factor Y)
MAIARVALPVATWQLFDYWIPDGLQIDAGDVVRVRLAGRRQSGVVTAIEQTSDFLERVQPVESIADVPRIPGEIMALASFTSAYYLAAPGMAFSLVTPPLVRARRARKRYDAAIVPANGATPRPRHALTGPQQAAVDAIVAARHSFSPLLLHGVTGSGKTDVYLAAAAHFIAEGGQVLILVPEINLTPQLEKHVAGALPHVKAATLHSRLAAGARREHWDAAADGSARIVLATRLGVFAPLPHLALIVVDEEHDDSYKQHEGVRYHARDLAVWRARSRDVPIVLGSATPSLETWSRARSGRYRTCTLAERADARARLPEIRFAPVRGRDTPDGLSIELRDAIAARMAAGEQSLLFINRRGFSPSLKCAACAWESGCPRCSARLVVHRQPERLRCHHCGHVERPPRACPECGNVDLLPVGFGTQRLEQTIRALFPAARVARVDRDTTRAQGAFADVRQRVEDREIDILVGTQMLAKGHDFPKLTLVGVLGADNALYSADFRATERLLALLMQVAGRAGRAELAGTVIVQTDFADHPVYRALATHDFQRFADELLAEREAAQLPPTTRVALLVAEAHSREDVDRFLEDAVDCARALLDRDGGVEVFPPLPPTMARRAGFERGQVLAQSARRALLQAFLPRWRAALAANPAGARVRWALDVDPSAF